MALVQAKKAQDFHHSVGVVTSINYPQYSDQAAVEDALNSLGVKFIRGGSIGHTSFYRGIYERSGIKTMFLPSPWIQGLVPNMSYGVTGQDGASSPQPNKKLIVDHLKQLGDCVHTVEMPNEIDLFYPKYVWSQADRTPLNNDPTSPYYWVKWLHKWVKDTHAALKADPATAHLKIVGPSPGTQYNYSNKNPMLDMSDYVDYACGHYYGLETNGFQAGHPYAGLPNYFGQGGFPGNSAGRLIPIPDYSDSNLSKGEYGNSAVFRLNSEKPYGSDKPVVLSECGFHTSYDRAGITFAQHGKAMFF